MFLLGYVIYISIKEEDVLRIKEIRKKYFFLEVFIGEKIIFYFGYYSCVFKFLSWVFFVCLIMIVLMLIFVEIKYRKFCWLRLGF